MSFKIAFIGAGSVGFTRTLTRDLWKVAEFADSKIEIALHDISKQNLLFLNVLSGGEVSGGLLIHPVPYCLSLGLPRLSLWGRSQCSIL